MDINTFYASVVSPFLRKTEFGERLDMAFIAFNANLHFANFDYVNHGGRIFSDSEIDEMFSGLDKSSIDVAKRFMFRQNRSLPHSLIVHPKYFYTAEENAEYRRLQKDFSRSLRRFHLSRPRTGPESLYYHHGLRFAPEFVKQNIAGKLFGDVGGWIGDSTLVFCDYSPEKILVFEPIAECRENFNKTMKRNRIDPAKYDLIPLGLSDKTEIFDDMECRALDEISEKYTTAFGVIKVDIEGMGLRFLRGAQKTIMRDRPLLSLSMYHNEEEFTGLYRTLKEWDLNYHFEIKSFSPRTSFGEISLFAYPAEWKK